MRNNTYRQRARAWLEINESEGFFICIGIFLAFAVMVSGWLAITLEFSAVKRRFDRTELQRTSQIGELKSTIQDISTKLEIVTERLGQIDAVGRHHVQALDERLLRLSRVEEDLKKLRDGLSQHDPAAKP